MDESEEARRPGRPPIYGEALERIQLLVPKPMHAEAKREAAKRKVSISVVYREWIENGKAKTRR